MGKPRAFKDNQSGRRSSAKKGRGGKRFRHGRKAARQSTSRGKAGPGGMIGRGGGAVNALFPKMCLASSRFGVGVCLAIARKEGGRAAVDILRMEHFSALPGARPKSAILSRIDPKTAATLVVGLAHQSRFRIAAAIMTGADSHQSLARKVGLKAGPLYHHLRSLERAGVVVCLERSKYALTDRGQVAMLMLAGLCGVGNRKAGWTQFR